MSEISLASGRHCVERGISIMRLALGYKTGLPDRWPLNCKKRRKTIFQLLGLAFPDRDCFVWCDNSPFYKLPKNVVFENDLSFLDIDEYLFAFGYGDKKTKQGHWVVGEPTAFGLDYIVCVVAVKI